jgi:glycosyltransferase involved in cell wall biosynthesis
VRIALVTDTYLPQVNGVTTVVHRIARLLARTAHRVGVVAPAYPGTSGDPGGDELRLPSVAFPPYPAVRLSLPSRRRVFRFLDDLHPDVVHVATEGPLGIVGRRYALARRVPLVTSFHTDFPRYTRDYGLALLEPLVWRWLLQFHRPARLVQTPGTTVCAALHHRGLRQAAVWGWGVDTTFFHPGRRTVRWRTRLEVPDGAPLVLHVGRLAPEKGLDTLIAAWRVARAALGERARFAVAGDGPLATTVRAALPWAQHVGFLPRAELAALYASSDLCVLTSETETCGLVALEAMASGVPVVAVAAGGLAESVEHGRSGMLVPARQPTAVAGAIVELVMDPARRRVLAAGARQRAKARDAAREDQELLMTYTLLASSRAEAAAA